MLIILLQLFHNHNEIFEFCRIHRVLQQECNKSTPVRRANEAFFPALLTSIFLQVWHFIMKRYRIQRLVETIKIYNRNSKSVVSNLRELRVIYGNHNRPAKSTNIFLVEKFDPTGTVQHVSLSVVQRMLLPITHQLGRPK